ncbi:Snf7 protein [Paramyrothecium foliicola]|nr:Snf7 protein [Paramyrothecium foliicola]
MVGSTLLSAPPAQAQRHPASEPQDAPSRIQTSTTTHSAGTPPLATRRTANLSTRNPRRNTPTASSYSIKELLASLRTPPIMNRLFGSKPTGPKPTLNGAISNLDTRIASIDTKLKAINGELGAYQEKLSKMREGPGKSAIKQKALKVLQKRKAYEAEKEKLESQVWNMEQAQSMQDNLKNVMTQVDAMKTTNKELRKQYGKIDIDKIERLQDEMADLMDVGNDIQESLARSYEIPDEVDESELDAELEALGLEQELEQEMGGHVPGFLQDEVVPEFVDEAPQTEDKVKQVAG